MVDKYLAAVEEQLVGGSPPQLSSLQVGQVVVVRREKGWFRGKVVAVDSSSKRVVVNLVDMNDNLPVFDKEEYRVTIRENIAPGTKVVQVRHKTNFF